MARSIANVNVSTDTFATWVTKTNSLADAMSNYAVTVEANTTGAGVSGNGYVTGILAITTVAVGTALRGGNVTSSANLVVTSNSRFTGAVLYSTANLDINVANSFINAGTLYITGGLANVTSNISVVTTNVSINSVNTSISGGNVSITSNSYLNAANVAVNATNTTISGTGLNITSNVDIVSSTLNANAVTTINGNTTVTAETINLKSNSSITALSVQGNGSVTNTSILGNTFTVTGNSQFSNTINVVSNATVNGALTVNNTAAVGNTTVTGFVNVSSYGTFGGRVNTSIEVNVGANVTISNTQYHVGNSSQNTVISSTFIDTDGTLTVAGLSSLQNVSSGNTTVTGFINVSLYGTFGGTVNASSLNIGANLNLSNTQINIGNSTVNTVITSTGIDTDGTLAVLNSATFSNSVTVSGNAVFDSTANVAGALRTGNTTVNGNITVNTFLVVGTVTNTANLNVSTSANIANLTVTSSANLQSNVSIQNNYVIVVSSNNNMGTNISTPQSIFVFPKASFSSAKITSQIKTELDANTQINEIVLAHDGTTSYLTVYGTVSSPLSSNLGVFTTAINNANVEILFRQNTANSKIKVVAHLIV